MARFLIGLRKATLFRVDAESAEDATRLAELAADGHTTRGVVYVRKSISVESVDRLDSPHAAAGTLMST